MASTSRCAARVLADASTASRQRIIRGSDAVWPSSIAEAYDVQRRLHGHLAEADGRHVVGHKVGCTTPIMQQYLDVPHPCAGGIYDRGLWRATAGEQVSLSLAPYRRIGLECEIAVTLGADLVAGGADLERAAAAVGSVHAAIEMVDDRYEDFEARKPPMMAWVADDFFHAGSVLGAPIGGTPGCDGPLTAGLEKLEAGFAAGVDFGGVSSEPSELDADEKAQLRQYAGGKTDDEGSVGSFQLPSVVGVDPIKLDELHGAMYVDGVFVGEGMGRDIIEGHPLEALVWLANSSVAAEMGGLPRGWVVSLGSVCKTVWLDGPAEVRVVFCGAGAWGELELVLTE